MGSKAKRTKRGRPAAPSERTRQLKAYVEDILSAGPIASDELWKLVKQRYGEKSLRSYRRARTLLKVEVSRQGYGKGGKWISSLPDGAVK